MKIWAKIENNEVTYFKEYQAPTTEEPSNDPKNGAKLYTISDNLELFASRKGKYKVSGSNLVYDVNKLTQVEIQEELQAISQWFLDNDWKVNKVFIGEWADTDPRWTEYLAERATKRARQDELLGM